MLWKKLVELIDGELHNLEIIASQKKPILQRRTPPVKIKKIKIDKK